jgi:hypothetical protein
MSRPDHRAQIVGILDTVEDDVKAALRGGVFEVSIPFGRAKGNYPLMTRALGIAIKLLTRLKTDWNMAFTAKVNQFLQAWAPRTARDQDAIQRAAGAQSLAYRVNSHKQGH